MGGYSVDRYNVLTSSDGKHDADPFRKTSNIDLTLQDENDHHFSSSSQPCSVEDVMEYIEMLNEKNIDKYTSIYGARKSLRDFDNYVELSNPKPVSMIGVIDMNLKDRKSSVRYHQDEEKSFSFDEDETACSRFTCGILKRNPLSGIDDTSSKYSPELKHDGYKIKRGVSFREEPVSSVKNFDRISHEEKDLYFYTPHEMYNFRMEYITELQKENQTKMKCDKRGNEIWDAIQCCAYEITCSWCS